MSTQKTDKPAYSVRIHEAGDSADTFTITFVPKGHEQSPERNGIRKQVPQYVVTVQGQDDAMTFNWQGDPVPDDVRPELESEARKRLAARRDWIDRIKVLVDQVEQWAKELGWATRRIEKKIEDSRVGNHKVPALIMQEDTVRILLDPIARTAPGAKGLVDLYLMPGYDDVASLYYRDGSWQLHYVFPGGKAVATVKEAEAKPISKDLIAAVLEEMKKDGG